VITPGAKPSNPETKPATPTSTISNINNLSLMTQAQHVGSLISNDARQCISNVTPDQISKAIDNVVCKQGGPIELVKSWVLLPSYIERSVGRIADNTSHMFFLFAGILFLLMVSIVSFMLLSYKRR
jgi:hypothetical protein